MHSDMDFYANTSFCEQRQSCPRSRPPSIDSDSMGPVTGEVSHAGSSHPHNEDAQLPYAYYFGQAELLRQSSFVTDDSDIPAASEPVIEDDDDSSQAPVSPPAQGGGGTNAPSLLHVDAEGMPLLRIEDLGVLGEEVGRGGDRGARVYRVQVQDLPHPHAALCELIEKASAHKVYQSTVSADEASYSHVAALAVSTKSSDRHRRQGRTPAPSRGLRHLVVPAAFVVNKVQERRGLMVPLFDCSLAQFLISRSARRQGACSSSPDGEAHTGPSLALLPDSGPGNAFLSRQRYLPIESPKVVMAIAYQVLSAVATLNDELPHELEDAHGVHLACTGYSHNDIYIDNILLSKQEGRVALCDFELVGHLPKNPPRNDMSRFPPPSRTSPLGFFSRTADTWSLALFLLGLATGVDPLFSNAPLTDDFGGGPLLLPFDSPDRDPHIPVLDWEANIKPHVCRLLDALHVSPSTTAEMEPLWDICKHCLSNSGHVKPVCATELIEFPVFEAYRTSDGLAEAVVREWIARN